MEEVAYSSEQTLRILRRAGLNGGMVSSEQLSRWARRGLLKPSLMAGGGRGSSRAYAFSDLVAARILSLLSDGGRVTTTRAEAVMEALKQAGGQRMDRLALHGDLSADRWRVASDEQGVWHGPAVAVVSLAAVEGQIRDACAREDLSYPSQPPVSVPL